MKLTEIVALIGLATMTCAAQTSGTRHKISINFNYDFSHTPVCSTKHTKSCVMQFNLYDISAGLPKKTKLMSFSPPAGATGVVDGIKATTPDLVFEPGKHELAVTAQTSNGTESDPMKCTIWVQVP